MILRLRYDAETKTFVPLEPVDLAHDTIVEVTAASSHNGNGVANFDRVPIW